MKLIRKPQLKQEAPVSKGLPINFTESLPRAKVVRGKLPLVAEESLNVCRTS